MGKAAGSGRKKVEVSCLFKDIGKKGEGKVPRVQCTFCSKQLSKNGTGIKKHIATCQKCPITVKDKYNLSSEKPRRNDKDKELLQSPAVTPTSSRSASVISSFISQSSLSAQPNTNFTRTSESEPNKTLKGPTPKTSRISMQSFLDRITVADQEMANEKLARAIFVSGASLSLVENSYWVDCLSFIRPAYKIPSRDEISVPLLQKEYNRVYAYVNELLAASSSVGLMCDGWSNIRNESIVNFVVTTPVPILYKILPTGKESHTGQFMAQKINEVIQEIGAQKVFGLVTDNAANMKAAWQILEKDNSKTNLFTYGCLAHSLNLIFTDIKSLHTVKFFVAEVVNVVKIIRMSHILSATFKEKQQGQQQTAITLKLPVQTRWSSLIHCLESVHANKHALKSLAIDEQVEGILKKNPAITKKLLNDIFWDKVEGFLRLLKPIADAITLVESDKPIISKVIKIFKDLEKHFSDYLPKSPLSKVEEKDALSILEKRRSFAVSDVHKAVNLLDPAFLGADLTAEEQTDAMEIIYNAAVKMPDVDAEALLTDLANYKAKSALFSKQFLWHSVKSISPVALWKGFCNSTELCKIAVRFLELPATSAACERTFSTYGGMHTLKRNRLTNDRAGKLVYISQNLKLLKDTATDSNRNTNTNIDAGFANDLPSCSGLNVPVSDDKETIFLDSSESDLSDSDTSTSDNTLSLATDLDSSSSNSIETFSENFET